MSINKEETFFKKIRERVSKYQDKIILTVGVVLIAAMSFAAGRITKIFNSDPSSVEIVDEEINSTEGNLVDYIPKEKSEGDFVGDINDNKYYPFNSKEAAVILDENKIWFDSKEEAEEAGYVLGVTTEIKAVTEGDEENKIDNNVSQPGKYVGSKNSNKYHLPDSAAAKRIKEENKIWFSSRQDAERQGYQPGASVKKEKEK